MILLCCRPHDDLLWEKQMQEAQTQERIIWEFDLGLHMPYFPLEDELYFQSLAHALSLFTNKFWPQFQEKTEGAVLFRGSADLSRFFVWTESQESNWAAWKMDRPSLDENHLKRLFCAEAFVNYFQMLAHRLPDELPLKLLFDTQQCGTPAETLHLLSPERFEHFQIEKIPSAPSTSGLCFPPDALCKQAHLARIDHLLKKKNYRPVYESLLSEQWEGLDSIHVFSDGITPQGRRKLLGFCAAGGTVIEE